MSADFEVTAPNIGALSASLRQFSPGLQRALAASLKAAAKPVADAEKAQALALESNGVRGGSRGQSVARAAWYLRRSSKVTDRKVAAAAGRGLRAAIARSITVSFNESGRHQGVRVRAQASKMPPDRRTVLFATTSNKGWRHPVYGVWRKNTPTQRMLPPDWWRRVRDREVPVARRKIEAEVGEFIRDFAAHMRAAGS